MTKKDIDNAKKNIYIIIHYFSIDIKKVKDWFKKKLNNNQKSILSAKKWKK